MLSGLGVKYQAYDLVIYVKVSRILSYSFYFYIIYTWLFCAGLEIVVENNYSEGFRIKVSPQLAFFLIK